MSTKIGVMAIVLWVSVSAAQTTATTNVGGQAQ